MQRDKITDRKKHKIMFRDNYTCRACSFFDTYGHGLCLDHIQAFADGGTYDCENMQCLCTTCNLIKSNKKAPALKIRTPLAVGIPYGIAVNIINERRQEFFKTIYPRSKGWFERKEKTLELIDLGVWKPAQRKRLGEAIRVTLGKRKCVLAIEAELTNYRNLVAIATPATIQCDLAY